jgi:hypothetical protein
MSRLSHGSSVFGIRYHHNRPRPLVIESQVHTDEFLLVAVPLMIARATDHLPGIARQHVNEFLPRCISSEASSIRVVTI